MQHRPDAVFVVEADFDEVIAGSQRAEEKHRAIGRAAIMPQPIWTRTVAGTMAPDVGMTEPTVAPIPKCTSGMTATCLCTNGSRATLRSWFQALSSTPTPRVHAFIGAHPGVCSKT